MTSARHLSLGREAFAVAVAGGATGAAAIRSAYPRSRNWTPGAVYSRATRLLHLPEVSARIAQLKRKGVGEGVKSYNVSITHPACEAAPTAPPPAPCPVSVAVEDSGGVAVERPENGRDWRRARLLGVLQCVENQGGASKAQARELAKWDVFCFDSGEADAVAEMWQERQNALQGRFPRL